MVNVYSKAMDKTISINRIIGHLEGEGSGPTTIVTVGIHGNEPSGVFALHRVVEELRSENIPFRGSLYAIAGNLRCLERGKRYQQEDLNRIWTEPRMDALGRGDKPIKAAEIHEQFEINRAISGILLKENGPFYFVDLHTTSSDTKPFITVNDNLLNRKFTQQYPVPLLLGIEEYLEGTFLNYINGLGYVAFGFESGQHDARSAIENHVAFVYLTLVFAGSISKNKIDFHAKNDMLSLMTKNLAPTYEIVYHYRLKKGETFRMHPGLQNFESVQKGKPIADSNGELITVPINGQIFMPLYQKQGEDGFFIIRSIPKVFLKLSTILRKIHFDYILPLLPGISWISKKRDALQVNLKVARFFAKKFFHLLGYRSRQIDKKHLIMRNREANSRKKDYRKEIWY